MNHEELLKKFHELTQASKIKPRTLPVDADGNLLLDRNNPDDREWYENDQAYDILQKRQ